MQKQLLFLTYVFLLFSACSKYKDAVPATSGSELPEEKQVAASLQGKVLDENGQPVAGADVTSGNSTTTTDEHGVFNFNNITLSSRFGFVKVAKQGYFAGSRSITVTAGSSNFVTIKLIPRSVKGSFSSSIGGAILVQTGDTVAFDAGAVMDATTHAAYTGNVHVYASYLDPTATDVPGRMPGDLRGVGTDGKETVLQSFGMMVVELEGDAGQKLQIAAGKHATLTMKIPDALKGSAPATIPLWYFNDTTGRWIEQGAATRKGDLYVGEVAHFSWWNCDAPAGAVSFHVRLKDTHGNPVSYAYLQFVSQTMGTRGGYTDAGGYASGLIPKGESLQLQAINDCGKVYFGVNVGPALSDQELGTLKVNDDKAVLTLTGTVVNCGNVSVDSGYAQVLLNGMRYRVAVIKGAFSLAVAGCGESNMEAKVIVGDYKTLQQGSSTPVTVKAGMVDAGKLSACGTDLSQYFNVTYMGNTYNMPIPADSLVYAMDHGLVAFLLPEEYNQYDINFIWTIHADQFKGVGTYTVNASYLQLKGTYYTQDADVEKRPQCTITTFGDVGEFITGSLVGNYKDTTGVYYPLTCEFKVKRAN